jgi:23S rRNA (cytosine1962-C5)-methyltransferase
MLLLLAYLPGQGSFGLSRYMIKSIFRKERRLYSSSTFVDDEKLKSNYLYDFLDIGGGKRLERFGKYIIERPVKFPTQYKPGLPEEQWSSADITYLDDRWKHKKSLKFDNWTVKFNHMHFNLRLLSGGQVGIFPEQEKNWRWLSSVVNLSSKRAVAQNRAISILNGFAYTGGSTLACLVKDNVLVTNVDASKSATATAKSNMEISDVKGDVRWIVDDCVSFVKREIRRSSENGTFYDGLIFDPPAFGRSVDGKKFWKLDKDLPYLLDCIPSLLSKSPLFVLISCHDISWNAERLQNELFNVMKRAGLHGKMECGKLALNPSGSSESKVCGKGLALGSYARWSSLNP